MEWMILSSLAILPHQEPSGNIVAQNNINAGDSVSSPILSLCSSCTVSHWLCPVAGVCAGTDQTIAIPVFVGGNSPSNFTSFLDWQLTDGSPGKSAGSDGQDIGTTYYGDGVSTEGGGVALGDLNADGAVNSLDWSIMNAQWGGDGTADLNGDGSVNSLDFSILSGSWSG